MSFLNNLLLKKKNLNHTNTMVRHPDGSLSKEDVYSGSREVISTGFGFVVDNKPNLEVTEVIKGLLMGSQDVAHSEALLKNYSINCVISLGIEVPYFDGIKYLFVEVLDLPEFCIKNVFKQCFPLIDTERENENIVYVHCNAGISRSASLVIGYVMKELKINFKMAYALVKSKKSSIKPNEGFIKQLMEYEKNLLENKYL